MIINYLNVFELLDKSKIFFMDKAEVQTSKLNKNIDLINASCWMTQTDEQERRGMIPHPAKVPIINLKTREVKIMNFNSGENEKEIKT